MSRIDQIQHDFTAGELTPYFRGRTDQPNYEKGVKIAENMLVKPQGPLIRRPPTKFVTSSIATGVVRLEPMQPNADEGYILEFSNNQIRILRAFTETIVKTLVTTYTDAQINDLRATGSIDVLYITHEDHAPAILERVGPLESDWTLTDITFKDGPYDAQSGDQAEITLQIQSHDFKLAIEDLSSPFTGGSVGEYVEYKQGGIFFIGVITTFTDADNVIIQPVPFVAESLSVESVYTEKTISAQNTLLSSRSTFTTILENAWVRFVDADASDAVKWVKLGKYRGFIDGTATGWNHDLDTGPTDDSADGMDIIIDPVTYHSATLGAIITEDTNTGVVVSDTAVFDAATDVGRFLRLYLNSIPVVCNITAVTDSKNVTVALSSGIPLDAISEDFLNEGRTKFWNFGSFYTGNFPRAVALFQQRLWFGGTANSPEAFWASLPNKFFTFAPTDEDGIVQPTSGISAILDGVVLNKIRWLHASSVLFIGTEGAEFRVSSSNISAPVTPLDIVAFKESENGSKIPPVEIGSTVMFIQLSGQKLREFEFTFQQDKFFALDVTILSDHIFSGSLSATEMSYQKEPNSVLWLVRSDGQLVGLTFIKEQEIRGWTRHIIGGVDAKVLSIATVRHAGSVEDTTYAVIERTVDGNTVRDIERIDIVFSPDNDTDFSNMVYVDAYVKVDGPISKNTAIPGFGHAVNATLTVVTDGGVKKDVVVSDGTQTLPSGPSVASGSLFLPDDITDQSYIGYSYLPIVNPYVREAILTKSTGTGTHQGTIKRIDHVVVMLIDTLGFSIGPTRDDLTIQSFRSTNDPMDNVPPLRTSLERVEVNDDYGLEGDFWIAQQQPYPLNLAAIVIDSNSS